MKSDFLENKSNGISHNALVLVLFLVCYIVFGLYTTSKLNVTYFGDFNHFRDVFGGVLGGYFNSSPAQSFSPVSFLFFIPISYFPESHQAFLFTFISICILFISFFKLWQCNREYFNSDNLFISFVLILTSAPLLESIVVGQTQVLFLSFILMFIVYRRELSSDAGIYLALATCFGYQLLIFLPFLLLARNKSIFVSFLTTFCSLHIVSVLLFGPKIWISYFIFIKNNALIFFGGANSQSIFSLLEIFISNPINITICFKIIFIFLGFLAAFISRDQILKDDLRVSILLIISIFIPNVVWYHSYIIIVPALILLYTSTLNKYLKFLIPFTIFLLPLDRVNSILDFSHGVITRILLFIIIIVGIIELASQRKENKSSLSENLLIPTILVSLIFTLYEFIEVISRESIQKYNLNADSFVYAAIGRGLLNGYEMYSDLYNNKGPGLAWLTASCMVFEGGIFSCARLQYALINISALLTICIGFRLIKSYSNVLLPTVIILLFGFPFLIINFLETVSSGYQAEALGGAAALLYVWIVIINPKFPLFIIHLVLAFIICISASIKEPYLLVLIASMLLFVKNWRDIKNYILMPLLYSLLISIIVIKITGIDSSYFGLYIPDAFGNLIWRNGNDPILLRGMGVLKLVWSDRADIPFLNCIIIILWLILGLASCRKEENCFSPIVKFSIFLFSLFLIKLAIGIGSVYWGHHYGMMAPFFIACSYRVAEIFQSESKLQRPMVVFQGLIISLFIIASINTPLNGTNKTIHSYNSILRESELVDSILDSCDYERYGFVGNNGPHPYAFTKHSPIGPLFFQIWDTQDEKLIDAWMKNLLRQNVIVVQTKKIEEIPNQLQFKDRLVNQINSRYSIMIPECAKFINILDSNYGYYFLKTTN